MDNPNQNLEWAETQIRLALKDSQDRPIFVTTHFNAEDTVYGSKDFSAKSLKNIFNKYPNIIHFSGHSHFSLIDERSIWQNEFTSIQTQSISYTELEPGFQNGPYPCNEYGDIQIAGKNYMGLIMDINKDTCKLQRISFEKDQLYEKPWIIDIPINKNNFRYSLDKRIKERNKPSFIFENKDDNNIIFEKDDKIKNGIAFKFKAGFHQNFIQKYKVQFTNIKNNEIKEVFYASDFYLMPEDRKNIMRYKLDNKLLIPGEYLVKIFCIESFGKESENYVEGKVVLE